MTSSSTAHHERECKLDAPSDMVMARVRDYVLANPALFTPTTQLDQTGVPDVMRGSFAAPMEVTEPRIRLYWDDADLSAHAHGIEIRQEPRPKSGIKQMVKIGKGASADKPVLNRMEHSANLDHFGLNFDAVKDIAVRRQLKTLLGSHVLKPVICMISQRTRLNYHPDGNRDVLIELGLDAPCRGHVFDGFTWQLPQIELELVKGGDEAVLAREAARLSARFDLKPNLSSKPSLGFIRLKDVLSTPSGRKAFDSLRPDVIWWA